ncbi:MAG: SDR family oxidoreductase [Caldilineaceae bacterium]
MAEQLGDRKQDRLSGLAIVDTAPVADAPADRRIRRQCIIRSGFVGGQGRWSTTPSRPPSSRPPRPWPRNSPAQASALNAVAPGWTVTEMHFSRHADPSARKAELESLSIASCVMKRLGRPSEIAGAIAFLLSDDAPYITGTTLHVDGGRVGLSVK